jgi:branched-chain amino acid transport system ATP-binding protein
VAEAVLELDGVEIRYGAVPAVRDVTLRVGPGEIVGLIGPNGAGKSTTLNAIMGLVEIGRGDIRLRGRSIRGRPPEAVSRAGVALVPEGRRIFADFTVEENLRLGLASRRVRGKGLRDEDVAWVYKLFPVLHEARARAAGVLSGGQQQQLAIARALVARPDVLLLDEPALGLAPQLVDVVFDALARIPQRGVSVLLVEQRAQRTVAFAHRTYVMSNGSIRMTLTPKDADDTERMVAAYFGS